MSTKKYTITKLEQIQAKNVPCGMFPGMNRSRKFVDRKHKANKNACRGRVEQ